MNNGYRFILKFPDKDLDLLKDLSSVYKLSRAAMLRKIFKDRILLNKDNIIRDFSANRDSLLDKLGSN